MDNNLCHATSGVKEVSAASKTKVGDAALDYTDIPVSQIRKITASRLLLSKQTIPHYYVTVDTCVDKLMSLRAQLNPLQEASGGARISINDLVITLGGEYNFASFVSVTLSCDHRVIDGAIGAEWLKAFKNYIENPESMLL